HRHAGLLPERAHGPVPSFISPRQEKNRRHATDPHNYGDIKLTVIWTPRLDDEARSWQTLADRLGRERFAPRAVELDREQRYPWETIEELVEHKFTGLFLPEQWGGQGANLTTTVAAVETLGSHCASTAAIMCAYQLGAFPILLAGTDEQKDFYLREMAQGRAT